MYRCDNCSSQVSAHQPAHLFSKKNSTAESLRLYLKNGTHRLLEPGAQLLLQVCARCLADAQQEAKQQRQRLFDEAASPTTSTARLSALVEAHPRDKPLRAILVQNPNISLSVYLALSLEFPVEAEQNIALPLLLLEAPDLEHRREALALETLLLKRGQKRVPVQPGSLEVLARSSLWQLRQLVVRSPHASHELLESMMHDPSALVRASLAYVCRYPDILIWLSSDRDADVRRAVARNYRTPREIRRELNWDDSTWRGSLCSCDVCSE
jgi:hypothetical protein